MKPHIFISLMILTIIPLTAQKYIADYEVAKEDVLRSIPEGYINKAGNELVIAYQTTSQGTPASYGVSGLQDFMAGDQIIADHTIVDDYDNIPSQWIDSVKTMLVDIAGESHSAGYRIGVNLLEEYDANYQASTYMDTPPAYSSSYLRLGKHATVGEAAFYTTQNSIDIYKN